MKLSLAACVTALAGFAAAQEEKQSKPFKLVLSADDKSLNGQQLTACHTGAAIESLCLIGGKGSDFHFNTSAGMTSPFKDFSQTGELTFNLPLGSAKDYVSEPMRFYVEPSTNVALPLFEPDDDYQPVAFVKGSEAMRIVSYTDDTARPPKAGKPKAINRWYVCNTNYLGYSYKTLNWVLGDCKPQNPSCKKVDVKRKF